jgi:hypothetical protein
MRGHHVVPGRQAPKFGTKKCDAAPGNFACANVVSAETISAFYAGKTSAFLRRKIPVPSLWSAARIRTKKTYRVKRSLLRSWYPENMPGVCMSVNPDV